MATKNKLVGYYCVRCGRAGLKDEYETHYDPPRVVGGLQVFGKTECPECKEASRLNFIWSVEELAVRCEPEARAINKRGVDVYNRMAEHIRDVNA